MHFKKGGYHKGKQKTDTRQKVINMGCCSGVVRRMVNLTTRCSCGDYMNPRHTYRRAISRIATTGSARTKMPAARNRGRSDFAVRFRVVCLSFYHFRLGGILEFSHNQ
ncbi:hypothetical protein ACNH6X_005349 [Escherichia coli]